MFRRPFTKNCLIASCSLLSITLIGGSFICQFVGRDSLPLFFLGRNLFYVGMACTGASFAYVGVECLNYCNERYMPPDYINAETQTIDEERPLLQHIE